ncbi:hypothetical protein D3C79_887750 [compost metagenome]
MVRRAGRVQAPQKPHALLGEGQAIARIDRYLGRNGEQGKIHVFPRQRFQEQRALGGGQLDEAARESLCILWRHCYVLNWPVAWRRARSCVS